MNYQIEQVIPEVKAVPEQRLMKDLWRLEIITESPPPMMREKMKMETKFYLRVYSTDNAMVQSRELDPKIVDEVFALLNLNVTKREG
jgi:hypothetical protein